MSTLTREQIINIIVRSGNDDWNYAILDNAGLQVAADAILALFAEQTARVVELEAENANLRTALSFYQNGWQYTFRRRGALPDAMEWTPKEELLDDCGNIAAAALGEKP